ncbi:hypothetical protein SDC9_144108 [bioreactor metagenome]|uniref:Uncharacterized protein n=1 Tax=bioreactor metagenome TaxID=1076179 RepID=A0A645E6K0_9ZZZZ
MGEIILEQLVDDALCLLLLALCLWVFIDVVKHKITKRIKLFKHPFAHLHNRLPRALLHHVQYHSVDAFAVRITKHAHACLRQVALVQHARADCIVNVVVDIGDAVGKRHDRSFQRCRVAALFVVQNSVAHLEGKVEPFAVIFQFFDHAEALLIVLKPTG